MTVEEKRRTRTQKKDSGDPAPEVSDLVAYLDGELDDASIEPLERRLIAEPPLRRSVEQLNRTWKLLDALEETEASGEFTQRTLATIAASHASDDVQGESQSAVGAGVTRIPWQKAAILFAVCFVFSASGALVAQWRSAQQRPESERIILENIEVLRNFNEYSLVPNVQFLRDLKLPESSQPASASTAPSPTAITSGESTSSEKAQP